jgi:hypothetical protein
MPAPVSANWLMRSCNPRIREQDTRPGVARLNVA